MAKKKQKVATCDDSEVIVNYAARRPVVISNDEGPALHKSIQSLPSTTRPTTSYPPPRFTLLSPPTPQPPPIKDSTVSSTSSATAEVFEDAKQTRTQRAQLLAEYSQEFALVARLLMAKEADAQIGTACKCGQAPRQVRCSSCTQMAPLCARCWVDQHRYQPLHWAEVWDDAQGFFSRQDISTVLPDEYSIPLGHGGVCCPNATEPLLINLVDINGIHATRVTFCQCIDHSKWRQLFDANFLAATVDQPQTAFTFELLRHWTILNLQSKITAHHYVVAALRRQTDNVFTGNVPDVSSQFRFIARIWPLFLAEKRAGYFYEDGVNMEPGWERTPAYLQHLHSRRWTVDGNNKTGNYAKNNDLNEISLFAGRAYMPSERSFEHYQQLVPQLQKEKTTCSHLKVANGANSAKYKNQRISGNLHVQCDHGVVLSSVDMALGERLAIYDYALNIALEARPFRGSMQPDLVISYDNNCGATANIHSRWHQYFPKNSSIIDHARFTIPACHVRNHVEGCDYLYCYMYKPNTGHFHGETVEATWAVFNELGPSVLQMNPGHRIDTLIIHYGDWNWRKTVSMSRHLVKELDEAKIHYVAKRDHYAGLCDLFETKVPTWNMLDCSPRIDPTHKKIVNSVYSHNNEKVPTMKSLVETLVNSDETIPISTGTVKVGSVAGWVMEGLAILQLQSNIQRLSRTSGETPNKELRSRRTKLSTRIAKWRKLQKQYMPSVDLGLASQTDEFPENSPLLLPSSFSAAEHRDHRLVGLASKQVQMLELALGEFIQKLQTTVKSLSAAYERKYKYARGQDANTRANEGIRTIENRRNTLIEEYNLFRRTLHALDSLDSTKWPSMTVKDTYRKPTEKRRSPGDSRVMEGSLWRMTTAGHSSSQSNTAAGAIFGDTEVDVVSDENVEEPMFDRSDFAYGTKMSLRQARTPAEHTNRSSVKNENAGIKRSQETSTDIPTSTEDGWIWQYGSFKNMTADELQQWEDKSDSVQWFRAEADMERWQEQVEIKHAEFLRLIASFTKHRDAWDILATRSSPLPGHRAYALERRTMFENLRIDAQDKFRNSAIPFLRCSSTSDTLSDRIIQWRAQEEKLFKFNRWAARPLFNDPTVLKHGGDIRESTDEIGYVAPSSAAKRKFGEV
ncbi:hypothetical protein F5878DRAFT_665121 [Lentinula raphanica]|uniref:CxC2-like cysteine cluster KDZ transposase-associated domain-containing protein n=1 Tax=Lentinula raphanica TaxID=153919 RepID=A0AA38P0H9_9AGAR|nr:hypothetical protein F5878DRAFT_665121 [Lentinula raphanica]